MTSPWFSALSTHPQELSLPPSALQIQLEPLDAAMALTMAMTALAKSGDWPNKWIDTRNMCVYTYIYIYIYIYVYIYIYIYVSVYIYIYTYTYEYINVQIQKPRFWGWGWTEIKIPTAGSFRNAAILSSIWADAGEWFKELFSSHTCNIISLSVQTNRNTTKKESELQPKILQVEKERSNKSSQNGPWNLCSPKVQLAPATNKISGPFVSQESAERGKLINFAGWDAWWKCRDVEISWHGILG